MTSSVSVVSRARQAILILLAGGMCALAGCGTPSFLITPVSNVNQLEEVDVAPSGHWGGGKIVVIPLEGNLMDVRSGGFLQAQENPLSLFVQQLDKAAADDSVKAIVLRVNSPGGSVTTSDTMYEDLLAFKARTHKPVVASAQEVCASGAYYVSCGADKIVASPSSIVGSIGVIFESFDVVGAMQKLGIDVHPVKSAEMKDMGSPFKRPTTRDTEVVQGMVNEDFARFKHVVTSNRHDIKPENLDLLTDGRVFNGERAATLGLVDQTGRLEDAIELARHLANAPRAGVVMYSRPYGYSGSIYADTSVQPPKQSLLNFKFPQAAPFLPSGFYYLWQP